MPDDDDKPVNRRRFFREGLRELLKPLAKAIDPIERAARQLHQLDQGVLPADSHKPSHTGPAAPPSPTPMPTPAPNTVPRKPT